MFLELVWSYRYPFVVVLLPSHLRSYLSNMHNFPLISRNNSFTWFLNGEWGQYPCVGSKMVKFPVLLQRIIERLIALPRLIFLKQIWGLLFLRCEPHIKETCQKLFLILWEKGQPTMMMGTFFQVEDSNQHVILKWLVKTIVSIF